METQALKNELLSLEKKYWNAIKNQDLETTLKLTADPCIVTGAQGVGKMTRAQMAEMAKNSDYKLESFEINDVVEVQQLAPETAVLAYKVREKLTVDGKPIELEAAESSVWIKQNGQWVCAHHTESLLGDPFGRDRH